MKKLIETEHEISIVVDKQWLKYWKKRTAESVTDATESVCFNKEGFLSSIGQPIKNLDNANGHFIGLMKTQGNGSKIFLEFIEKQIKLDQSKINLLKIGIINFSNFEYIEKDNKLFFKSSMVLEVNDQKQFYKRFQISKKNRINLKKINFDLMKDIDENIYFISNIKYNFDDKSQKDNEVVSELKTYQINNIQELTQIIKKNFNKIN